MTRSNDYLAASESWDLESLFPGGADGDAVTASYNGVLRQLTALRGRFDELPELSEDEKVLNTWAELLLDMERFEADFGELRSVSFCWFSADTNDVPAKQLVASMAEPNSKRDALDVVLYSKLGAAPAAAFEVLAGRTDVGHMETRLRNLRRQAELSLSTELEDLQEALARDGLHGWGRLYDNVSGAVGVTVDRGDGPESITTEQAKQLLETTDESLRERAAAAIDEAWWSQRDVIAACLNHLTGYKRTLNERRGIDELERPLLFNRMGRDSLMTMMDACEAFRPTLTPYFEAKAKLLGLERLRWSDLGVPLGRSGGKVSYEEAQVFIVEHFDGFSKKLGDFARMAFRDGWIEAEDRVGKRQGGFCTSFSKRKQSRIFMTFGGTPGAVQTLAHELGHAYHSWVLRDEPLSRRYYPATLAETASTFAEAIIREAAFQQAGDDEVRLGMLDRKLQDAVTMTMNIPARFRLERAAYEARGKRELDADAFAELTLDAFKHCYNDQLSEYDRTFWASKLHFYISEFPFYNFPYSVGYLFSQGLYKRALEEGDKFPARYDAALILTGYRSVEDVARESIGVDLTTPDFWNDALSLVAADVDAFVETVAKLG